MSSRIFFTSFIMCIFILSSCSISLSAQVAKTKIPVTVSPATATVSPTLSTEKNIAVRTLVFSSKQLSTNPGWMVNDINTDNWWGSGDFAPQWIEIQLNGLYSISKIKLIISQSPSGETIHRVLGKGADGEYITLHVFSQFTWDDQVLEIAPESPWVDISSIKVETVKSPSWVSWKEIMIYSREEPKAFPATQTPPPVMAAPATNTPLKTSFNIHIEGSACWVDTSYALKIGQMINITATGNVNTWGGKEKSNGGPDGQDAYVCSDSRCPLNGAKFGALIGRVGNSQAFLIGSNMNVLASSNGNLFLTVNDWECRDNYGGFNVSITSTSLPPLASNDRQGVIAFYMGGKNAGGIALIKADGSGGISILSAHPTNDSKPAWSPDGSRIAFESLRDDVANLERMDVYIMNADGSLLTRLTNNDGKYGMPDWSPDGKNIAVAARKTGDSDFDLYMLDVETGKETRLTDDPDYDGYPSWSPDGTELVFVSKRDGRLNLYVLNIDTRQVTQLTRGTGDNAEPDWSPDGEKILFISNRDKNVEIYLMNADGSGQMRLTNSTDYKSNPEWSPDGKYFAYTRGTKEDGNIFVMDLDGSEPVLLFERNDGYDGYAAWSGKAVISKEPMFGPAMCMRDTDGNMKPDVVTNTFPTSDQFAYVAFPYRNINPDVRLTIFFNYEKSNLDTMNMPLKWKYGENGLYVSSPLGAPLSSLGGVQNLTIQVSLNGDVVQEIECPIVEP